SPWGRPCLRCSRPPTTSPFRWRSTEQRSRSTAGSVAMTDQTTAHGAVLRTARLTLPLITPAQAADLRAGVRHPSFAPGFPRPDDIDAASLARPDDPWGPRLVVRSNDGLVCGTIGFFGAP